MDVVLVDGAEGAEAEGVGGADFAGVDGEAALVAVVVDALEVPVGHVGIEHRDDEARLDVVADGLLEAEGGDALLDGAVDAEVASPLGLLAFGEVFLEGLDGGVDGLHGGREVHLAGLLEVFVLQVEVAVVGTLGIVLGAADGVGAADDEGEARHGHDAFLGGGHAEVDVVFLDIDGNHGERRGSVEWARAPISRMGLRTPVPVSWWVV